MVLATVESSLRYHPFTVGFLTGNHLHLVPEQCQAGSLTGAVASESVTEAPKGSLRLNGNQPESAKA